MRVNQRVLLLLVTAGLSALAAPAVAGPIYNATADFSIVNGNPNGAWSYGYMDSDFATFKFATPGSSSGVSFWYVPYVSMGIIWMNTSGASQNGVPDGWLSLRPGTGGVPTVLRWTAPLAGAVGVSGRFLAGDSGLVDVAVRRNNAAWWSAYDSGLFDLQATVAFGETIDFVVFGPPYRNSDTPLSAVIEYDPRVVPEPASLFLLGTGLLGGLGGLRRRRT